MKFMLALAAMLAAATPAVAQLSATTNALLTARFAAADKNSDGKLTLEEAKAGMPRVAKGFTQIDAAHRGFVTLEQIRAFAAAHL
ncbi:hypothetical protein U1839_08245 [Sphingomonas sp. RT2P30]|uniref:hypothetical protein n=1 Tax=Parasphingomonas halimpatiens TaxID=3096162 RepID=UPI002FC94D6D